MRIWKSSLLIIGISVLVLSSMTATAETDETGDVWHHEWTGTDYSWGAFSGSKPAIDISDVSYTIDGTQATVTMTTVGDMTPNTENVVYTMHLQSSESAYYMIVYSNGEGAVAGMGDFFGSGSQLDNPISGNTFTASFEISDPSAEYTVIGFNAEYSDPDDEHGEAWWDYAPNSQAPWFGMGGDGDGDGDGDGNGDGNGDDGTPPPSGTPGFETLAVIGAIAVALIILRKRK